MSKFKVGQRWVSETEPELGLGAITAVNPRTVKIHFQAAEETRQYSIESAPVKRITFDVGDVVKNSAGAAFQISRVEQKGGLYFYLGEAEAEVIPESELCTSMRAGGPEERLKVMDFDDCESYELRKAVLRQQYRLYDPATVGFVGGRMDLIPHQLFIAHEVASRQVPRVLLADEVGLGKTIEACLILHRLIRTNKAGRALILVPMSLVHQWLVELMRRFNLWFDIVDESYCAAAEKQNPEENPFFAKQMMLCDLNFFINNPSRAKQAIQADWDIVIVDEAHHLTWSPEEASQEYQFVEALARLSKGLLLLTATPEQLGPLGHFARLRLLDPDRYFDVQKYLKEMEHYQDVAALGNELVRKGALSAEQRKLLAKLLGSSVKEIDEKLSSVPGDYVRREFVNALLDRHGIGRVMFRNTRAVMKNFPRRKAEIVPLQTDFKAAKKISEEILLEYEKPDQEQAYKLEKDIRILWLNELLLKHRREKILLICKSLAKAKAVEKALQKERKIKAALFHEELSLIQRDRQAAWFSEHEGAQILICSEIGSEGRNFQFAHHLVLFDLPFDPEILEQRIGRLDRIGQKQQIAIHVPYVTGTPQEVWVSWYHEALNAFEENCRGATFYLERFRKALNELMHRQVSCSSSEQKIFEKLTAQLLADTRKMKVEIQAKLKKGRDRLLELSSFRQDIAGHIVHEIQECDGDFSLEEMMEKIFDQFGIMVEELEARTYFLQPGANYYTEAFPALRKEGLTITYDRKNAITREDRHFLTWDHPMVTGAVELILGSEHGNCATALLVSDDKRAVLLETYFLIECLAEKRLQVEQYLPAAPLRIVVNHELQNQSDEDFSSELKSVNAGRLLSEKKVLQTLLPKMLSKSQQIAEEQLPLLLKRSLTQMREMHRNEIERLQYLKSVNPDIRDEELKSALATAKEVEKSLKQARLRLDSVCLILQRPEEIV